MYHLILALFASTALAGQVDYSKCAKLVNNMASKDGNLKGYRTKQSGPFVPKRLRYVPFDLQSDGSTELHEDAKEALEKYGNRAIKKQIITYQSPSLESLEQLDKSQPTTQTRPVQVIIERNSQGHITSIIENRGLVTVGEQDSEIERIKQWSGDADLAFAYKETKTTFKVAAGQCVPLKSSEIIVRNKDGKKQQTEILNYSTKLCHKIQEFFDNNPKAKGCFDLNLNHEMNKIFATYAKELFNPDDKENKFLSNDKISELINKGLHSKASKHSLRMQILTGYTVGTQISELKREKHGLSPVISGHMALANCKYQRLGDFIYDSSLWPAQQQSSASQGSSSLQ